MSSSDSSLPVNSLGGYRITGRLGQGAMADVYDAVDSTGHEVALKVFRAATGMPFTLLERFRREAEASKKLRRHPYILTVYATGHEGDLHYIAMEKIEGSRNLEGLIRRKVPTEELLRVFIHICSALAYSHEHQIIHRDVKPGNILLDEFNEPLLSDFGVAELTDWPSLTLSGALTGTPLYMSPEQARGESCSPASDVYSLGVVLYEALCGCLPYELSEAASTQVILDAVKHQEIIPPRKRDKKISKDLNFAVMNALARDPDLRTPDAKEFGRQLEAVLEGRPVVGRWSSPWARSSYWIQKHRSEISIFFVIFLLFAGAGIWIRQRLLQEKYSRLLLKAVKTSADLQLAQMSTTDRAEPEMKSARRAIAVGRWLEARDQLQTAVRINEDLKLVQPLAEARLELARVEVMLHNSQRARDIYRKVWSNPGVNDPLRHIAGFEAMLLLLLDGKETGAEEILVYLDQTPDGPYHDLIRYAKGKNMPADWSATVSRWKLRLQRNLALAQVMRDRELSAPEYRYRRLQRMLENVEDRYEWPLPFAEYMKGRI